MTKKQGKALTQKFLEKQKKHFLKLFLQGYDDGASGKAVVLPSPPEGESLLGSAAFLYAAALYLDGYKAGKGVKESECIRPVCDDNT